MIIVQIILGAFLSGLDGGLIYNSWPYMNGSFFPNDVSYNDLINTQLFNNPSLVQFLHRVTAYLLLFFIIILNYLCLKKNYETKNILLFDIAILVQIFLGIITPGISFSVSLYAQSNFANLCPSVATKDK